MELIKHKFQKIKNVYHLGQAILANFIYGFPSKHIHPVKSAKGGPAAQEFNGVKIIGVTGTNGKTTTVWMIGKILEEAGFKVAINSTINFKIGTKEWVNKTKFTTLSSFAVQKFIKEAVKEGCDYLVLETSSHSLDQFRVWGIPYTVAVMTNVTREHLDYHRTMEEYRKAKLKLFEKAPIVVVNLDMEKPEEFLKFDNKSKYAYTCHPELACLAGRRVSGSNKITCLPAGRDSGSKAGMTEIITAENIELGVNYTKYQIQDTKYQLNIPGIFNAENALAAMCVGLSQDIGLEIIKKALEKIEGIPGRMEYVPNNKDLKIIIDYAVTPDSLEKLYDLIKTIRSNSPEIRINSRVIAVFGACGERDHGKRPIMGEIAARYADYAIVTNEDPYNEDPQRIINEVFQGVINSKSEILNPKQIQNSKFKIQNSFIEGENCWRILDRREAIRKALNLAQPGDFVVITGKGAEETMAIGKSRIPWKEREIVKEELNKL